MMDRLYNEFKPPEEAPVFTPTEEEFSDPLAYIAKIKPIAEKSGICKVKPPPDWQPPFAIDVDKFRFVPRIQRLNELEAKSRIKLNFLDQLAKFWELQGYSLKIPHVERKLVDLYTLYKAVEDEGGMEALSKERRWSKVAHKLGYPPGKGVGGILKGHYERILFPYYLFKMGKTVDIDNMKPKDSKEDANADADYKPHGIAGKSAAGDYNRKTKRERMVKQEPNIDYSCNSELKKLQFFGAGPKAAVPGGKDSDISGDEAVDDWKASIGTKEVKTEVKTEPKVSKEKSGGIQTRQKTPNLGTYAYVDMYYCHVCGRGDAEEYMLLCDGCDDAFHTYCLVPPLSEVPKGDWRCPKCVQQACSKPVEAYGFPQSQREYTLQSFGEMADKFKAEYFNMPVHKVSCEMVEKEFWRLVNCLEEDVCVQYGADVHALIMGSGFPTKEKKDLFPEDEEYINSGWNLNNLPILEQSVLCHINADISGMKVPWCYVGMCFSSFAWHNEDHWSYSINYMHWGEPKTWYGVPGVEAENFECAMRKAAPELFEHSPDLLHQLTTIMNPSILREQGVPIVRTNQHAGEFVITFPRAYHAGFNQGYNFAEAVNFCPADWLHIGLGCIEHYRLLNRQCVFSHEELICKMAADPERLDFNMAAATHLDMVDIVEQEKKLRKKLLDSGTTDAEREAFELLPDDERQCDHCQTTCFLSAVTCPCSPGKVVCLWHADKLCKCHPSKFCLRYRYTLDELPAMMGRLKNRAEAFDNWNKAVKSALDAPQEHKLELQDLKHLISEAEDKHFPDSELLQTLINAVSEAEKCANVANQLVCKKVRTRNRQSMEGKYIAKLSLDELNFFYEQVANLPCTIREGRLLKELLDRVIDFQAEAKDALEAETPDSQKLEQLIEFGITLDVDLSEIPKLKQVLQQAKWLDDVRDTLQEPQEVYLDTIRKLIESGVGLAPHPACEKAMAELQELLTVSERWEEKARICLQARPRHVMATLEAIINEAKGIPVYLPNVEALREAVRKAKEWTFKVEGVQNSDSYPYLDVLENLVNKGRPIPVRLDQLPQVESQVAAAKSWRERTARTFLKKNSTYSLLEVLSPRTDIGTYSSGKKQKKKIKEERKDSDNNNSDYRVDETRDPALIVAAFKIAEQKEVENMLDLRVRNMEKLRQDAGDTKYCICRKGASGFMLQCELCKDWFHGTCVPLPKSANMKNKSSQLAAIQAAKELKFHCPLCLRSRRPRLETILSLLVSLQKLPVRLPEGEALQCLTERAMAWQDRARQALTTSELASALAKLSVLSQKMVEQAAREKTEKIINAELQKAANNPELQGHLASVTHSAFSGLPLTSLGIRHADSGIGMDLDNSLSLPLSPQEESQNSDDIQMEVEVVSTNQNSTNTSHTGMSEHAYSSASKISSSSSPKKHARKSPLVPRQTENPVLELSETAKAQLEILMMEGDLLEVSLDETQHIWRILQACQPRKDEKFLEFDVKMEADEFSTRSIGEEKIKIKKEKDPEKKKKKRKKEGLDGMGDPLKPKKLKIVTLGVDGDEKPKKKKKLKIMKAKIKKELDENGMEVSAFPEGGDTMLGIDLDLKPLEKVKIKKEKKLGEKGEKIKKKKKKLKIKIGESKEKEKDKEKKKRKRKPKMKPLMMDDDDDSDEDCAAVKCLKPTGEVNWVQCDRCEEWFHLLCVGLAEDEVTEDEDYECFRCKHMNMSQPHVYGLERNPLMTHSPEKMYDFSGNGYNSSVIKSEPAEDMLACQEELEVTMETGVDQMGESAIQSRVSKNSDQSVNNSTSMDRLSFSYQEDSSSGNEEMGKMVQSLSDLDRVEKQIRSSAASNMSESASVTSASLDSSTGLSLADL